MKKEPWIQVGELQKNPPIIFYYIDEDNKVKSYEQDLAAMLEESDKTDLRELEDEMSEEEMRRFLNSSMQEFAQCNLDVKSTLTELDNDAEEIITALESLSKEPIGESIGESTGELVEKGEKDVQ